MISSQRPTSLILLRVFIPFALGYFLSYIFRVVNAVIAPSLVEDLALDPARLGLLTSAYFLAFALFQLPLGILLDRYGPRRVEGVLLLIAATGALVFATAQSTSGLMVGRALIGIGVSACLMGAFKAFVLWFPAPKLPLINGLQTAAGGLGAIAATAPVERMLQLTDWRGVFLLLALLTFLSAVAIFKVVPEKREQKRSTDLHQQMRGIATVFRSAFFWRIVPWTVASQSAFLAIQGLWAGPWLSDVAGFDRAATAQVLLLIAVSMVAGFFLLGFLAERLGRRGVSSMTVAAWAMVAFMAVQLLLIFQWTHLSIVLWILFGFLGTAAILPYSALAQHFPVQLVGRANTGLNLLVFLAAFAAQWGIGAVISLWPPTAAGGYPPVGFQVGFALVLALQVLAALWFFISPRGVAEAKFDSGETIR